MAKEIERRFLIDASKLPDLTSAYSEKIVQGYYDTAPNSGVVRVRTTEARGYKNAYLTTKFKVSSGINSEYEYIIPYDDAVEILSNLKYTLSKLRVKIPYVAPRGLPTLWWEIDFFSGKHDLLKIAEIELPDLEFKLDLPNWITREITHESGWSNFDLAKMNDNQILKLLVGKIDQSYMDILH